MNNCGIYGLICIDDNYRIYIGSSIRIKERILSHFASLKRNAHINSKLQKAFNYYGRGSFKWEILEYCMEENLIERELYYITSYNSTNLNYGYNLSKKANGRLIDLEKKREEKRIKDQEIEEMRKECLKKYPEWFTWKRNKNPSGM
jgi:group I intron endonuclease